LKPRIVPVIVTDPDVKNLRVMGWNAAMPLTDEWIPVPEDDQLRRHLEALCELAEAQGRQAVYGQQRQLMRRYTDAAQALRAAFRLDTEDET